MCFFPVNTSFLATVYLEFGAGRGSETLYDLNSLLQDRLGFPYLKRKEARYRPSIAYVWRLDNDSNTIPE